MTFKELTELCQAESILRKLQPDELSVYRNICRQYSKKFHTPLDQVFTLDPQMVFLAVYEDQMDELDTESISEEIIDNIHAMLDPEYYQAKEQDLQSDIQNFLAKERAKKKSSKLKDPIAPTNTTTEKNTSDSEEKPTGGFIDLSYLESEENGTVFED